MKPILFLAFLGLGPALAQQFPLRSRAASDAVAQRSGTAPPAAQQDADQPWWGR